MEARFQALRVMTAMVSSKSSCQENCARASAKTFSETPSGDSFVSASVHASAARWRIGKTGLGPHRHVMDAQLALALNRRFHDMHVGAEGAAVHLRRMNVHQRAQRRATPGKS
ncbi:hypothetical protein OSH08_03260 [Kaistia geumhonensis]|uniref:Uncharacterized protein n=1 Tax=Kaistia geumhonensis TaxID=410839 RepID=A0ABU0M7M7_9HYPH|nr:hypothetical protein [Kaistia geumhonensis]MCX5478007.1 hypothetical protein [Kaistia geumhonensis]MDQ0516778.1 hypothetical protein [Kaistia geumhonensis]